MLSKMLSNNRRNKKKMQLALNTLEIKKRIKLEGVGVTDCITEVTWVISIGIEHFFSEARASLINILVTHSMQQEVWIPVFLSIAHFIIETLPHLLQAKKLIYFPLQLHP